MEKYILLIIVFILAAFCCGIIIGIILGYNFKSFEDANRK